MTMQSWIDGLPGATIPANDRGLLYGDGVFRTMLVWDGAVVWQEEQLAKLHADADCLGLRVEPGLIRQDVAQVVRPDSRAVLRYSVTAGDSNRGYARHGGSVRRILQLSELPEWPQSNWLSGVSVERSDVTLSAQRALSGIKHLNRLDQVLARARLSARATEALLADAHGRVTSAIAGNVFWFDGAVWRTPKIGESGVAGLARDQLLGAFSKLGVACETESSLQLADLSQVQAMFITNSLIGIWPVMQLDGRELQTTRTKHWKAIAAVFTHPWFQAAQAGLDGAAS